MINYFENIIPYNSVKDITLLSANETKNLTKNILIGAEWSGIFPANWWLRNLDKANNYSLYVNMAGHIEESEHATEGIRPVFTVQGIQQFIPNIKIGDKVSCLANNWYYVGKNEDTGYDQILFESVGAAGTLRVQNDEIKAKLNDVLNYLLDYKFSVHYSSLGFITSFSDKDRLIREVKRNKREIDKICNNFTGQIIEIK